MNHLNGINRKEALVIVSAMASIAEITGDRSIKILTEEQANKVDVFIDRLYESYDNDREFIVELKEAVDEMLAKITEMEVEVDE